MDLDYARQVSWWRDVKIMWWTVQQLGGRHAN
jgi:lipopolysaccharide/colanic/teichoic acid biosynthesis glycosyltransferase